MREMNPAAARQLRRLSALTDTVRRRVYEFVASSYPEAVDRDQVAQGTGISRNLAAFHLDRLASDELLSVSYARRSGRSGPGAGRPAKFYRRVAEEASVSVPERRYEFAARLLVQAVTDSESRGAVVAAGNAEGHRIGQRARASGSTLVDALEEGGFEPLESDGSIQLRNCPFAGLTMEPEPVVCKMAHAMVDGIVDELKVDAQVREEHRPGVCCVVVETSAPSD
jgi:predicted ArsR family transcriptional regulator